MTISTTKKFVGVVAAAGLLVALAGCGSAPEASPTETAAAGGAVEGFKPCMVSGRRRLRRQVVQPARPRGPARPRPRSWASSTSRSSPTPRPTSLRTSRAWSTRTARSSSRSASTLASAARSRRRWRTPTSSSSRSTTPVRQRLRRRRPTPRTSSRSSSTPRRRRSSPATRRRRTPTAKKVGTFGGMPFPTVTIFMDGFAQGVEYWNEREGRHRRGPRLGRAAQDGVVHRWLRREPRPPINAAQGLVDQGVDVLLPVGGPIYQSAASVIRDSGS